MIVGCKSEIVSESLDISLSPRSHIQIKTNPKKHPLHRILYKNIKETIGAH